MERSEPWAPSGWSAARKALGGSSLRDDVAERRIQEAMEKWTAVADETHGLAGGFKRSLPRLVSSRGRLPSKWVVSQVI